ncbi:hypothetical protein CLU79DRAFT_730119 [Phycomyces nitens]|nr:hypothetical protein CLU79DRAFT_730119 [Phycomyces nitens]
MLHSLPYEILDLVADNLSISQKIQCILVCKTWKKHFTKSLWKHIDLYCNQGVKSMCDTLGTFCHTPNPANYVENLFLHSARVTNKQLSLLQKSFVSLKSLDITDGSFDQPYSAAHSDWGYWKCMQQLNLCVTTRYFSTPDVLNILSNLKYLTRLLIGNQDSQSNLVFTIGDMDNLHAHLHNLEYLTLAVTLLQIPIQKTIRTFNGVSAKRLISFHVFGEHISIGWLYYWALKYPHLLSLKLTSGQATDKPRDTKGLPKEFTMLKECFGLLESIELVCESGQIDIHKDILELVSQKHSLLVHLELCITTTRDSGYTINRFENAMYFSRSLESLKLQIDGSLDNPLDLSRAFKPFPLLVRLDLTAKSIVFELDRILDNCPAMTHLALDTDSVLLDNGSVIIYSSHGLLSLVICSAKINPSLFNYVSQRCQRLSYLTLRNLQIQSVPLYDTDMIYIDLSYSHLRCLEICSVDILKLQYAKPGGLIPRLALLSVNLINPNKFPPKLVDSRLFETRSSAAHPTTLWFHKYHSKIEGVNSTPWEQIDESTDTEFCEWKESTTLFTKTSNLQYYIEVRCGSTKRVVMGY